MNGTCQDTTANVRSASNSQFYDLISVSNLCSSPWNEFCSDSYFKPGKQNTCLAVLDSMGKSPSRSHLLWRWHSKSLFLQDSWLNVQRISVLESGSAIVLVYNLEYVIWIPNSMKKKYIDLHNVNKWENLKTYFNMYLQESQSQRNVKVKWMCLQKEACAEWDDTV